MYRTIVFFHGSPYVLIGRGQVAGRPRRLSSSSSDRLATVLADYARVGLVECRPMTAGRLGVSFKVWDDKPRLASTL